LGTSNGLSDPSWVCLVDNIEIGPFPPISENNFLFCGSDPFNPPSDGQHTITLRAIVPNNTLTFWFDEIHYLPSPSMTWYSSLMLVGSNDSAIQYSSGWQVTDVVGSMTMQQGAKMTLDFNGVCF
jgi:hypothetical protein